MTFLGHIVPVTSPYLINYCYEFARANNFEIETILNGIVRNKISISGQGGAAAFLVYYTASDISFYDYFQRDYSADIAGQIPELIHKIETEKQGIEIK